MDGKGSFIGVASLIIAAVGLAAMLIIHFEQEQEKIPELVFVNARRAEDDSTLVVLENKSPTKDAVITQLWFRITDPQYLAVIERRDPRPKEIPAAASPRGRAPPKPSSAIPRDPIRFHDGLWEADGSAYVFSSEVENKIEKGSHGSLQLRFQNNLLAGQQFRGELIIQYNGTKPFQLPGLAIWVLRGSRR